MKLISIFCIALVFNLFIVINVQAQTKVKHHQIYAGIGLLSAQKAIYPFQSEYLDCYKMNTQLLLHLKYAYQFKTNQHYSFAIGFNYANFAYKDFYVTTKFVNDPNLSSDTTRLHFQSSSYLLRADLNLHPDKKICIYTGLGIGLRAQNITNSSISFVDSVGKYIVEAGVSKPNQMPIGFEATIGGKYKLANNFGFYVETGFAKSLLQLGLVLSF